MESKEVVIDTVYGAIEVRLNQPTDEISSKSLNRIIKQAGLRGRRVRLSVKGLLFVAYLGFPGRQMNEFAIRLRSEAGLTIPYSITVRMHLRMQLSESVLGVIKEGLAMLLLSRLTQPILEASLQHSSFGKPLPRWYSDFQLPPRRLLYVRNVGLFGLGTSTFIVRESFSFIGVYSS